MLTTRSVEPFDQIALYGGTPPEAINSDLPTPLLHVSMKYSKSKNNSVGCVKVIESIVKH